MQFSVAILATLVVFASIHVDAQIDDPAYQHYLRTFLQKSEYVHNVFFQLLIVKFENQAEIPIPEPMTFNNFTFDHFWVFQDGISHTYNPLLYGYSESRLTIDANNETYKANLHLVIPIATLTGTYDVNMTQQFFFPPGSVHYLGEGEYRHIFRNVHLWANFTVENTLDGKRAILTDVHSSINFDSCQLWAENYSSNGNQWDSAKWISQSAWYKVMYDSHAEETDVIISEAISSYFATLFGLFRYTKDQAMETLAYFGDNFKP